MRSAHPVWVVVVFSLSCFGGNVALPPGNAALGIAEFAVEETSMQTSVIGLDATGGVVGRLDLVHGRFALTGIYRDDYDTPEVIGRQLRVAIAGQELVWETAGFEPTLHMPAHPSGQETLAAFMDDPHISAVLDRWGIGFERADPISVSPIHEQGAAPAGGDELVVVVSALNGQPHYAFGSEPGTWLRDCHEMADCGTLVRTYDDSPTRTFTANTCGRQAEADRAIRITRAEPNSGEDLITQCCPAGSGDQPVPWFAIKVCPTSGVESSCGRVGDNVACKACQGYPAHASQLCHMEYEAEAINYCYSDAPPTLVARPNLPDALPPAPCLTPHPPR